MIWAYRLKETKESSYRQHINNIDRKMKKVGIVKKLLEIYVVQDDQKNLKRWYLQAVPAGIKDLFLNRL